MPGSTARISTALVLGCVLLLRPAPASGEVFFSGLGDLPGGIFASLADAVPADGLVVVGRADSSSGPTAYRWEDGVMEGLGDLPGGIFASAAHAVSADGRVVVGTSEASLGQEAFIWNDPDGMRSLRELLEDDLGLQLGGWTLVEATGISADGLTLVGSGINPSEAPEGWIAFVPEPSAALLWPVALVAAGVVSCDGARRSLRRGRPARG